MGTQVFPTPLCAHPADQLLGLCLSSSGNQAVVTVQGDGVACYDTATQRLTRTYPLGNARMAFQTPAVLDCSSGLMHVVVSSGHGASAEQHLVSWPAAGAKAASSSQDAAQQQPAFRTIADVPHRIPLAGAAQSVHVLRPADAASTSALGVVLADGRAGCCAHDSVELSVASSSNAAGTLRGAAAAGPCLVTLHHAAASPNATLRVYTLARASSSSSAPSLVVRSETQVAAPAAGVTALSIALSSTYALVSWSNGAQTVVRGILRHGGAGPAAVQQLTLAVPAAIAASTATTTSAAAADASGRKRKTPAAAAPASSSVLAAPADDTQVLVAAVVEGGAQGDASAPSGPALEYALVDCQFGCTLSSGRVALEGLGGPHLDASGPAAAAALHGHPAAPGLLLLRVRGAAAVLGLRAPRASLLSMLGKLAVVETAGASPAAATSVGAAGAAGVPALPAPQQRMDTAAVRTALAAPGAQGGASALVLHPLPSQQGAGGGSAVEGEREAFEVLRALAEHKRAGTPPPVKLLQHATSLVVAGFSGEHVAPGAAAPQPAEQQPQHPSRATRRKTVRSQATALPPSLAPITAAALAAAEQWGLLKELLAAVPYQSLPGAASLLPAAAAAQQYELVQLAAYKLDDVPPTAVVEALHSLLTPTTRANADTRRKYAASLRSAAEATIAQCEETLRGVEALGSSGGVHAVEGNDEAVAARREAIQLARCAAAAVDGFTHAELLLHALLVLHADVAGLQAAVRVLPNAAVDRLLAYLAKWSHKYTHELGELATLGHVKLPPALCFPLLPQVLDWLRILIDAHLPRLLMAKSLPAGLQQALSSLKVQASACAGLSGLAGAAEHLRAGAPLPAAHIATATQYTVELVDMAVRAH